MFIVEVTGYAGTEAEFSVPSPTLALDLALRADRAGFIWRAYHQQERGRLLMLAELRHLADRHALISATDAEHLREIAIDEQRAAAAGLN